MEIREQVEQLSEYLVLADGDDREAMSRAAKQFDSVGRQAEASAQEEIAAAAYAVSKLIEAAAGDTAALEDLLSVASRTIAEIQAVVCHGRDVGDASFPGELGLAVPEQADADAPAPASAASPSCVDDTILADFLSLQGGVLEEFEALIVTLENEDDPEKLGELRRLLHTLKGEAGMLGLTDVERLCHRCEDFIEACELPRLADGLLQASDWLRRTFDAMAGAGDAPASVEEPIQGLEAAAAAEPAEATEPAEPTEPAAAAEPAEAPPMLFDDPELIGEFISESMEHLENAEVHLLTLEMDPHDEEALNAIFRGFHTIKGVASFLGFEDARTLAHESENVLDQARKGAVQMAGGVIDLIFESVDRLRRFVEGVRGHLTNGEEIVRDPTLAAHEALLKRAADGSDVPSAPVEPAPGKRVGEVLVERGVASPEDVEQALEAQREPPSQKPLGQMLVESNAASSRDVAEALKLQQETPDSGKIGEVLTGLGMARPEDVEHALAKQQAPAEPPKLGETLVRQGQVPAKEVARALRGQKSPADQHALKAMVKDTIKVDADRLDFLVDTIGELVIAESMVSQLSESGNADTSQFVSVLGQLDKITRELQELGMSLRMVPVRPTFQKMARLARDVSKKLGKQIEFVMAGEDTELDKTVVDQISDPLVHMVRNAVDHGIEGPEERRAAGKPEKGRIEMRAFHKESSIYIEIEDDGAGLSRDRILAKGIERGLVHEGDQLSDREVFGLILEPGFSTAEKVTDVSGRGVGLDVVKRGIEALRGKVEIRSKEGEGSVFTMRLPLTLAIIDGLVVLIGSDRYVIPTLSTTFLVRPEPKNLISVMGRGEMLSVGGRLLPLYRLGDLFGCKDAETDPTKALVVVVEDSEGNAAALLTDQTLGQQQIVIKSLGEMFRGVPGLAGGAILPDGRVGLILDVGGLLALAHADSTAPREEVTAEEELQLC